MGLCGQRADPHVGTRSTAGRQQSRAEGQPWVQGAEGRSWVWASGRGCMTLSSNLCPDLKCSHADVVSSCSSLCSSESHANALVPHTVRERENLMCRVVV